jgi:hypothetical protein
VTNFESREQRRCHVIEAKQWIRKDTDAEAWRIWRDAPGFSQRFTGSFADNGDTIVGRWQLCRDDARWDDDLQIVYRRQ